MRPREGHELREQLLGPGRRGAGRAPLRLHDHAPELAAVLGEEVGPGGPERRGVAVAEDVRRRVDELCRFRRAAHGRHGARGHAEARRRRAVVGPVRDGDLGAGSLAARLLQVQQQLDGREHGRRALDLQAHAPVVPEGLGQVLRELLVEAVVLRRQRGRRVLHQGAREAVRRERVERRLLVLVALDEHAAQRLALEDLAAGAADGQHRRLGSLGRAPDLLDAPLAEDDGRHAQHRAVVRAARDARGRGEAAAREAGGHRGSGHFFLARQSSPSASFRQRVQRAVHEAALEPSTWHLERHLALAFGSVLVALPALPQRIRIAAVAWDLLRIAAASLRPALHRCDRSLNAFASA